MYCDNKATISVSTDGKFILTVTKEMPESEGKGNGMATPNGPMNEEKVYVANDEAELLALIQEYVTADPNESDVKKFVKGFKKGK